jgi:DNA-directed RNA polymerase subunit H (RpoH/RPB5)
MDANTHRLYYGARRTCLEMMTDRGYSIPPQYLTVTIDAFNPENDLEMTEIIDTDNNKVFVKFFTDPLKPSDLKTACFKFLEAENAAPTHEDIDKLDATDKIHLIIAYDPLLGSLSTPYKFEIDHIGNQFFEVFDVRKLFINPTKHVYQAKWRLMKESEITELLQRYEAKMVQTTRVILGSVCIDDPINRYYFGKPPSAGKRGDVYEIIRDGLSIFYRKVVNKKMNFK